MPLTRLSTTLRAVALTALFGVSSSAAAFGSPIVTFSTTGQFDSTLGPTAVLAGGVQISFFGILPFGTINTPSTASLGTLQLSAGDPGFSDPGGVSDGFTLFINQISPAGSGQLLATLSGTVARTNQSDFRILFGTPSVIISGVTYNLQQPPDGYFLVPPTTNQGITSIQAFVTAQEQQSVVPEPGTMMLVGTGLLVAFKARRRLGMKDKR